MLRNIFNVVALPLDLIRDGINAPLLSYEKFKVTQKNVFNEMSQHGRARKHAEKPISKMDSFLGGFTAICYTGLAVSSAISFSLVGAMAIGGGTVPLAGLAAASVATGWGGSGVISKAFLALGNRCIDEDKRVDTSIYPNFSKRLTAILS